ncbi:MAG: YaiI/YqxD family protein, partial [Synechococcales cyanobacterium RM1_1_8]|nr:YaiI/YqxD family protein [Synechococcales cyanobacterium RM1_1_8]
MQIWVDADACPNPIKEILFRAAKRTGCRLTLVANHPAQVPAYVEMIVVPPRFDEADSKIVERLGPGDLVITTDIPLAAQVLEKGGHVFTPRGEAYTDRNIGDRLAMRNLLESMRSGTDPIVSGGPPPFSNRDSAKFANQLDRFLRQHQPP